jgi:hypothetical protein
VARADRPASRRLRHLGSTVRAAETFRRRVSQVAEGRRDVAPDPETTSHGSQAPTRPQPRALDRRPVRRQPAPSSARTP